MDGDQGLKPVPDAPGLRTRPRRRPGGQGDASRHSSTVTRGRGSRRSSALPLGVAGGRLLRLAARPAALRLLGHRSLHGGGRRTPSRSRTSSGRRERRCSATSRGGRSQMAAFVTIADVVARVPDRVLHGAARDRRTRNLLVVAVLMPLWANYLVKAYSWRDDPLRRRGHQLGPRAARPLLRRLLDRRAVARLHVPVAAVHDPADLCGARADPRSLLEASADLGGPPLDDVRPVVLPSPSRPSCGSIFTFSLTLGDYIAPRT